MNWPERLAAQLAADRTIARNPESDSPHAVFARHQVERFGLTGEQIRLPEHFRGNWEQARVCFLGPHVVLEPSESAPGLDASTESYIEHYRSRPEKREPFGHYQSIMDGQPWLATELVHWPCEKELALQMLKGADGPRLVDEALALTWSLLAASPVNALVLTGNDALKWVLPRLGWQGGKLPGVTQLHAQPMGRFPLPGVPGREIAVIASFHWSPEMPMFVRKVPGQEGKSVRDAISGARRMLGEAIQAAI